MNSKAIFLLVLIGIFCLQTATVTGFSNYGSNNCFCVPKWRRCPWNTWASHPRRCWWKCERKWHQCCCRRHGPW